MTENMRGSIMVVDDDRDIRDFLKVYINSSGYDYYGASGYMEAIEIVENKDVDLIILDVLMPQKDGFSTCKELREKTHVPIIFLSCKNEEIDIIRGLSVGADDYITKPFLPGELMARINSHMRRAKTYIEADKTNHILIYGKLKADMISRQVWIHEDEIYLLPKEFDILVLFLKHPGRVFSKGEIFHYIWKDQILESDINTITVHISNLRKKICVPDIDAEIITVKGIGYKIIDKS